MVLGLKKAPKAVKIDSQMVRAFNALGDATRVKLVKLLASRNQLCVSELAEEVGISTAGASQHLKILEQAELVDRNRNGQKICYEINRKNNNNRRLFDIVLSK